MDCFLLMFVFDGIVANYTVAPDLFPIEKIRDHLLQTLFARWDARDRRVPLKRPRREPAQHGAKE